MMDKLTLVIPAKNESESLPIVLKELESLKIKVKVIVVIPTEDDLTKKSIKNFDCKIIDEKMVRIWIRFKNWDRTGRY